MVFIINPFGERKIGYLALAIVIRLMPILAFGVLGAAVFAEPAVAEIEEMCGLVHLKISDSDLRSQNHLKKDLVLTNSDLKSEISNRTAIYLRVFGDSIRRTGTDMLLPDRQIFTFTTSPI